jgi:hypothetical protein
MIVLSVMRQCCRVTSYNNVVVIISYDVLTKLKNVNKHIKEKKKFCTLLFFTPVSTAHVALSSTYFANVRVLLTVSLQQAYVALSFANFARVRIFFVFRNVQPMGYIFCFF